MKQPEDALQAYRDSLAYNPHFSSSRIHLANLVNFGIVPLTFSNKDDYNKIDDGDKFEINLTKIKSGKVTLKDLTKDFEIELTHSLSDQDLELLLAGGKLTAIKQKCSK